MKRIILSLTLLFAWLPNTVQANDDTIIILTAETLKAIEATPEQKESIIEKWGIEAQRDVVEQSETIKNFLKDFEGFGKEKKRRRKTYNYPT